MYLSGSAVLRWGQKPEWLNRLGETEGPSMDEHASNDREAPARGTGSGTAA